MFSTSVVRRHLLGNKTYKLFVSFDALVLSDERKLSSPKYRVEYGFENQIMWKFEENDLAAFGF
jgi:hypothetical protein